MRDLIPSTADVRDAYSSESSDSTYANRMFDLWLAKYKAKVVAKTEERIIKLLEGLEQTAFDNYKANRTGEYGEGVCVGISGAIALIKGEK